MNKNEYRDFFERDFLWINGFKRNAFRYENKMAVIDPAAEKGWTYGQLHKDTDRFASHLKNDGFAKGAGLMYALGNGYEFVFCHVAAHKLKGISMPINYNWAAAEIAYAIDDSKPFVFVYDEEIGDKARDAIAMASHKPVIVLETGDSFNTYVSDGSEEFKDNEDGNMYDEVLRLYTSGTTGKAKAVPLNNINEIMSAHDVLMHFPLGPNDTTMNLTPWFHRGGIHSGGVTPTLYAGGCMVTIRKFNPRQALNFIEEYKVNFAIGAPAVFKLVAKMQERQKADISSLKGIVTMGSPLEQQDCIYLMETLTENLFNGYGTTESFWNIFLRPYHLPEGSGSAGCAGTFDDVAVVKAYDDRKAEAWELVPKDGKTVGEVIIKSPAKMSYSYINNPAEEEKKFYNGWMYTADLATWDADGIITINGRKDDMIIVSGENVYPVQIEEAIMNCPLVKDCIITSVPDSIRGQAIVAYVIPESEDVKVKDLVEYMAIHENISTFKRPRYYGFVDEIPYNATGKKLHYKAKEMAKADLAGKKLQRV